MHRYLETGKNILIRIYHQIRQFLIWIKPYMIRFARLLIRLARLAAVKIRGQYIKWSPIVLKKLSIYSRLCRLDKPIGIFLLLWPALWALWIAAEGWPDSWILAVFTAGVVLMRSAGCVVNDIADRNFDRHVLRTRNRPLASGEIGVSESALLALSMIGIAFLLVLTTNRLTVQLSFVAVILAIIYPFMKRYTYLPQFVLGLAFGWSIPMAFAAQSGSIPVIAWLLLLGNVLWSVSYDTMYAMVDREDDLRIGVKSTAILFDDADRGIICAIQIMLLLVMILLGDRLQLGIFYYVGLVVAAIMA
ncbi:MAG: 4-hydroxybenzoate octaprenyltransferase, partial [Thiotrichales bacterium]|nr:4-hydroxybenzoate octaprenyltransferase [Thiotrichales bacterium]